MRRYVAFVAGLLLHAETTTACSPATPSVATTQLQLEAKLGEAAIVHTTETFKIFMRPRDVAHVLRTKPYLGTEIGMDLAKGMESVSPLRTDISTAEWSRASALKPDRPDEQSLAEMTERQRTNRFLGRLMYIIAELLDESRVVVIDRSTGEAVRTLTRELRNEACSRGRYYIGPTGEKVWHTLDAIA